ncbi:unnamed protein product [Nesidiocoris tenuis]|uniref:Reverse transcriptase domain-containing protein n=1 Tax=Nesidiocoris tenuis TaxID=355587 RepID=A0A6H5HD91_9HEMI|nr:unnamed protein product [Nesidiocoris tenuis]
MSDHGTSSDKFRFRYITTFDLEKLMSNMNGKSAPGTDGISLKMLKSHFKHLKDVLVHIINLSLTSGTFPDSLKIARVIPIFKSGDPLVLSNYRPISLLSSIAKLIERWIKHLLYDYLESRNLISENQYGFRRGIGVDEALFHLTKDINSLLDRGQNGILLTLDLAKAFDSIDRDILINMLPDYGFEGKELEWVKSYFSNRRQVVSVLGVDSTDSEIQYGVIQGGTLAALFFLIFVNRIDRLALKGKIYLFADDTAILCEADSWSKLFREANSDMELVFQWLSRHKLSLNIQKTKYLVFSKSPSKKTLNDHGIKIHTCNNSPYSNCDCPSIERASSIRYLGIHIDENLKWEKHILQAALKIRKYSHIFYRLRSCLSIEATILIYKALVQSVIGFGMIAWGGATSGVLNRLAITQKAILKVMARKPRRFPSNDLFQLIPVYSVQQLYLKSALIFFHKHPNYFPYKRTNQYPIRLTSQTIIPAPLTRLWSTGRHIYNSLPYLLRSLPEDMLQPKNFTRSAFKKKIFTFLILKGHLACEELISSIYAVPIAVKITFVLFSESDHKRTFIQFQYTSTAHVHELRRSRTSVSISVE